MELHRLIGSIGLAFSSLLLFWNILTPENPDHWVNIIEDSIIALSCLVSTALRPGHGGFVQVISLLIGSGMTAYAGYLHPAGFVGGLAVLLTFLYSRFQTIGNPVLVAITLFQFGSAFSAGLAVGYRPTIAMGHAFVWAVLPLVFVWIVWETMKKFSDRVLRASKEVHEINKTLMSERKADGTKKA